MRNFSFIRLLILLYLFATLPLFGQQSPPNIIFIFADDMGWGDASCYGSTRIQTPGIDQLAADGMLFTQFYVPASVCSPSRAGIMTGQFPSRNRVFGHFSPRMNAEREMPDALDPNLYTLADIMKANGYKTGHFGKWHMGNISPAEYGVDTYATNEFSNLKGGEKILGWTAENRPNCTREVFDKTLNFIRSNQNRPFFVNAWLFDMHATLNPSKEQLAQVKQYGPAHDRDVKSSTSVDFYGADQVYLAALMNMDREIGHFIGQLDSLGLSENTLVIFSSDNGPEDYQIRNAAHSGVCSNGPFRGRKRSIYEGGIRVPFIVKWPGNIPEGKVNNESVVCGVDFIPTIASITGAELPEALQVQDGVNMQQAWLGENQKRDAALYWEWRYNVFGHVLNRSPMIAMREGDFKLLINPDGSRLELYNLIEDPSEMYNLAINEPELAERLKKKALAWYAEIPKSPARKNAGKNDWNWPK